MSSTCARCLALLGLVLVACLCGCAGGLRGAHQPQEGLIVPFVYEGTTAVWEIGYQAGDQVQRIIEYVRPGQTVENWTELVTLLTFNKAVGPGSVDALMVAHREESASSCPGSTVEVIRRTSDGVLYEAQLVNCPLGADEHVLARVIDGTANRFIVQYSVRGTVTMTPERRAEWIEKLMSVDLILMH